ncbi:MAG: MraY family glycosyltransferase [Blastocatellia bacterium]|nr:MraY family glycosyltransferase [Blastocatellia bacterium]
MRTYFVLFVTSLISTLILTRFVRSRAIGWGAVDMPDGKRRIHKTPIPRLGGAAIYFSMLLGLFVLMLLNTLVTQGVESNIRRVLVMIVPATLVFLVGVYDDFNGMRASTKLAFELLATAILYGCGFRIEVVSAPFIGSFDFPALLGFPLTAMWVIGITNAFNLIDGIDGLATGASGFAMLSIFIFSMATGHADVSVISIVLLGGTLGFLRYNFNPATIFLGDSGSLFLGFMAAALSMASAQKSPTLIAIAIPLVTFGLPVAEVGLSIARRFVSGEPIFQSDRRHIHHMLLRRGLNQRQAVIVLYGICALFSLFGIMLLNPQRSFGGLIFLILAIGIVFGVQHLRYDEFGELSYQIKHGVRRRRRVLRVNVRIRRSSDALRQAASSAELSEALTAVFEASDFDGVRLEIADPEVIVRMCEPVSGWRVHDDSATALWRWQREGLNVPDLARSHQYWSLRVPLTDHGRRSLGVITFYHSLASEDLAANLTQVCGAMRGDLIAAIERLCDREPALAHPHAAFQPGKVIRNFAN